MKGAGEGGRGRWGRGGQFDPPPEKTTLKKPNLLRVKLIVRDRLVDLLFVSSFHQKTGYLLIPSYCTILKK